MKAASVPTQQMIDVLYEQAEAGDMAALKEFAELNLKLSKRANSRMATIEKSPDAEGTGAYRQAQYFLGELGRKKFSEKGTIPKNSDSLEAMYDNLEAAGKFLRMQTSTMRGENLRRELIFKKLEEGNYINIPEDPKARIRYKKEMNKFLSSDAWKEIKATYLSGAIKTASEAISSGARVSNLIDLFNQYQSSTDHDLLQIWEGWQEGKKKL